MSTARADEDKAGGGRNLRAGYTPMRFGVVYGAAIVLGHAGQFAWLIVGSRVMSLTTFGTVLAAQALYGALQLVVDSGSGFYGARLAATGTLTASARGSLIRLRVQMASAFAVVIVAIGAVGGPRSLEAVAPFAFALILFALFNYWEPLGRGDSRPWSAYVVARSTAPALAVAVFALAGADFPVFVPGAIECGVLVAVSLAFRLGMIRGLKLAVAAGRGPWREVIAVGLPGLLLQVGLAAGPVVLVAAGRAASAALLAVGIRIVTGLNQFSLLLATSLFPRVAGRLARPRDSSEDDGGRLGLTLVVALTAVAAATILAAPSLVTHVLVADESREARAAMMLTAGTLTAAGYLTYTVIFLVASGLERIALAPCAVATLVTLVGAMILVAVAPDSAAVWMAAALTLGQALSVLALSIASREALPSLRTSLSLGAAAAWTVAAAAALAVAVPATRVPSAVTVATVGALAAATALRELGERRRRVPASQPDG